MIGIALILIGAARAWSDFHTDNPLAYAFVGGQLLRRSQQVEQLLVGKGGEDLAAPGAADHEGAVAKAAMCADDNG